MVNWQRFVGRVDLTPEHRGCEMRWFQWGQSEDEGAYFYLLLPCWTWAYRPWQDGYGWIQLVVIWTAQRGWFTNFSIWSE